ncbi:hypothetical protein HHL19_01400 [Streptomyces sp. R302]|uniref:hypothetical protein n=1 Tax=unclassified Streptomyces TaxID=2593676 RepID=UPI00145F1D60|nr:MULTISPECIES: hypothetical protein [unclassified Streptomyces]NML49022.1 hypothetical protein [Streptomyces sp. R301]NML77349.1 hypothetical protein [Streptomyces sp. R302]
MRLTSVSLVVLPAAAAIALLGAGTGVQAVQARADGGQTPADAEVMSNDEYVARYGTEQALAEQVPLPPDSTPTTALPSEADPSIPWHHIYWSALDWDRYDIPTRRGTNDFGLKHTCSKHNMCTQKAINAPYNGKADRVRGSRAEYDGVITSGGTVRMTITSAAERGERGPHGQDTPDGRPIGTVTAFCRGQTLCPDWVNQL